MLLSPMEIAQAAHEQNRYYCVAIKHPVLPARWEELSFEEQSGVARLVEMMLKGNITEANAMEARSSKVEQIMSVLFYGLVMTLREF